MEEESDLSYQNQYEFVRTRWENLKNYILNLANEIGGSTLFYFEDDRFQNETDLCYQGKRIDEIFTAMSKVWEPTEFKRFLELKNQNKVKYGWYYENLKLKNAI